MGGVRLVIARENEWTIGWWGGAKNKTQKMDCIENMATELLRVTSGISLRTNPTTFLRGPRQGRCVYIPSRNSVRRWSIGGVLFLVLSRHILFSFPTAIELPTYLPTLFIPDPPLYTRRQFTFFFWGYAREKYAMLFGVALTWSGKKKNE